MATTKFYDITMVNKETSRVRSFHITNATRKSDAIHACHSFIVAQYEQSVQKAIDEGKKMGMLSMDINGVTVEEIPSSMALHITAERWVVKECKISTFAGSYSSKRNSDGSKKRKRDQKQTINGKPVDTSVKKSTVSLPVAADAVKSARARITCKA